MSICRSSNVSNDAFAYYPQLGHLLAFCDEHYDEDICLQRAASITGLERTYFCTYFHKKVGVCFNCWLSILRIERAKKYLQAGSYAISIVANKVGFKSLSSFERTFKRRTNMTASQYRKKVRPC